MKKLILIIGFAIVSTAFYTGCSTTQVQTITKTEAVLISSVDTAMNVWHDWVVAGKATQAQVDAVKKAYNYYYDAQQVLKAALEMSTVSTGTNAPTSDVTTANNAVLNAEQTVVDLVKTFTK